jgi:hypothetical protein
VFEKTSRLAENLAIHVSRRAFLGRLGQGALVLASAMGAALAFPEVGQAKGNAGPIGNVVPCCSYACSNGTTYTTAVPKGGCKPTYNRCPLVSTVCGGGGGLRG